jgi:hypothetical protein
MSAPVENDPSRRLASVGKPWLSCGAMDLEGLSALSLPGADGDDHRLGDYWAARTVVLVFLRHFG